MNTKNVILGFLVIFMLTFVSLVTYATRLSPNSSTVGCINRPGENDGHCTTDGSEYLCAKPHFLQRKDCVIGMYPE